VPKTHILGLSDAGLASLNAEARAAFDGASLLCGGTRHLGFANGRSVDKFILKGNLKELVARLEEELAKPEGRPVVLASGDPLFFGVAKYLIDKLGAERVRVHPYLSSLQLAFARAGVAWDDAELLSVHGRPLDNLAAARPTAKTLGIFTDSQNPPSACAKYLIDMGWVREAQAWVVENIEGADERVTATTLGGLLGQAFGELNVLIVRREAAPAPQGAYAIGLPEEAFAQRKPEKGLITKTEVRVLALSKLRVFPGACVWDIGAATGSVAIEAARLSGHGPVWAFEKNAEDCENVRENIARFGTPTVRVVHGAAPEALAQAKDHPDCAFIGGSAGKLDAILDACLQRLKPGGTIVGSFATVENIAEALAWYRRSGLDWGFCQIQVSRGKPILGLHRLDALNPITLVWGSKAPA
jgi:precorrin-6B C5,15-methyltransferase / cobalt-precorrin-6B C5,C15-methyltransferase